MITETLSTLTEPGKTWLKPARQLGEFATANVEELTELQVESLKRYSQLGINQLSAFGEVRDLESLQGFVGKQTGMLKALGECVQADIKAATELSRDWLAKAKMV